MEESNLGGIPPLLPKELLEGTDPRITQRSQVDGLYTSLIGTIVMLPQPGDKALMILKSNLAVASHGIEIEAGAWATAKIRRVIAVTFAAQHWMFEVDFDGVSAASIWVEQSGVLHTPWREFQPL